MTGSEFAAYVRGFRDALGGRAPSKEEWDALIEKAECVYSPTYHYWPPVGTGTAPSFTSPGLTEPITTDAGAFSAPMGWGSNT